MTDTWSSWDAVAWFCREQAMLPEPECHDRRDGWVTARGVGARVFVWLPALWAARTGQLPNHWRSNLPTAGESPSLAIATAALELAVQPAQLWEPFAAGGGGLQRAANAWYQSTTVMLFDANFLLNDAISEGRVIDDEWHRRALPMALQRAVHTTQAAFNTAVVDDHTDFLEEYRAGAWPADIPLVEAAAPWYWNRGKPQAPKDDVDVDGLRAAQEQYLTPE